MQSVSVYRQKVFDTLTAGTGPPINMQGRDEVVFFIQGNGTTSGGTMKIEEAMFDPADGVYSGTWSQIGPDIAASALSGQSAYHIASNALAFVRIRISSAITGGGTVTIWAVAQ